MNRTLRAIAAVVLIVIIVFCAITLCQNTGGAFRLDITDQKLYTLSEGTKVVLAKLNQPLKMKLYYAETAARKAPDQIRFYNNYYYFVEALLKEYARASGGMVELELIDPRPYSDDEEEALRHGLRRFPITEEENFFFGLVLQTQFGVVKSIPFFAPERQNFVEYDISHLIETAVTRQKKRVGVLSSLPVVGGEGGDYMAALRRMQGLPPEPAWTVIEHLRQQYDVNEVKTDVEQIRNVDILLVVHPTDLPEKTLFAIDQFVLEGGRAIICVDPYCFAARSNDPTGRAGKSTSSDLNRLLRTWGVEMPQDTYAGDRALALAIRGERRAENLIGYLGLRGEECFNRTEVITSNLNEVSVVFAGSLQKVTGAEGQEADVESEIIPLVQTTDRGNTWKVEGPWDWVRIVPEKFLRYFTDGVEPVLLGCLVKGRFKSSFPDGIEVTEESSDKDKGSGEEGDSQDKKETTSRTGLTEAAADCAVVVIADVDFMTDMIAYRNTVFGMKVAVGNNSDLLFNSIDALGGSGDLIGLRSRGNFRRPFDRIEKIRRQAERETVLEEEKINAEIARFQQELQKIASSAKEGQEDLVAASFVQKQRDLEFKIHQAQRELRDVQKKRRVKIEKLGNKLRDLNMWSNSAVILLIAIVVSMRRSLMRRRYVSHASDA
ncbi:MAG: Gldg family protein [Planctomycetota bacterium]|jgi:ABC-type uncharacterized transport system involved in gliding motility auxiliary subunit